MSCENAMLVKKIKSKIRNGCVFLFMYLIPYNYIFLSNAKVRIHFMHKKINCLLQLK
jgi:hypothetical protein